MARTYNHKDMEWAGHEMRLTTGGLLATVKPDPDWPGLWRVHMPDGHITDMVNLTRAKDAASILALAAMNLPEEDRHVRPARASLARSNGTSGHARPAARPLVWGGHILAPWGPTGFRWGAYP
jgi:hypothetical protein